MTVGTAEPNLTKSTVLTSISTSIRWKGVIFAGLILVLSTISSSQVAPAQPSASHSYWYIASPEWRGPGADFPFDFPTLYLWAPEEVVVRFRFDDGTETGQVVLTPCEIVKFDLDAIRPPWRDWGMYYVEIFSDKEFWIVGKKVHARPGVNPTRNPAGQYLPDVAVTAPHTALSTVWHMGASWSTAVDDLICVYAPDTAVVTFHGTKNGLKGYEKTETIGPPMKVFRADQTIYTWHDYSMMITSDKPIAVGVIDAGGYQDPDWSGAFHAPDNIWYNLQLRTRLTNSYGSDRELPVFGARFTDTTDIFEARSPSGTLLYQGAVQSFQGEAQSGYLLAAPFPTGPMLFRAGGTFAPDYALPVAENTFLAATFFGFDPAVTRLVLFGPSAGQAQVTVSEARNPGVKEKFSLVAGASIVKPLKELALGLAESQPFLLRVESSEPIFMTAQISELANGAGGFLRPYPLASIEKCYGGGAVKMSDLVSCLDVKVPSADRKKISGPCVLFKVDVCSRALEFDAKSRRAVASVRFQYKIGQGEWADATSANSRFSNPDTTWPWQIHWNTMQLPNGLVTLRAIGMDSQGHHIRGNEREILIDHRNPEVVGKCSGEDEVRVECDVRFDRRGGARGLSEEAAVEVSAGDEEGAIRVRIPPTLRAKGADASSTFAERLIIEAAPLDTTSIPGGVELVGSIYDLSFTGGVSRFNTKIDLFLPYSDVDGDGNVDGTSIAVGTLKGFYRDSISDEWRELETIGVDLGTREVHILSDHFTAFALGGSPGSAVTQANQSKVCLISRLRAPAFGFQALRDIRDGLMNCAWGRLLTSIYYSL